MEWEEFSKEVQDAVIEISDVRRPYKFYRGKTLTHEQLVELFVHEEPIFKGWGPNGEDLLEKKGCWYDVRGYYGMIGCCLHRKSFSWLTSMVMSDGTIYGSALECKYPDWEEYLPDWAQFAKRNPFVDMIVAYTNNDESPCYWCDLVHYCEENRMISCEWHEGGFCLAKQNKEYADKCYEYNKRFWNSIGSEHKVPEEERNYLYDFYESADQYLVPLLQWVKAGIEQVVAMLQTGTYRDYILEKLPYECRTGILPLSRYWTYVPQDKEELYAKLDAEELEEFLNWAEKEKNSGVGYEKMNANIFFEACLFLYKELGCEVGTMPAKEAYCKFSDGRDSGLTMLDENSYEEFEHWYATTHFDHVYDIKNNSVVFWISRLENGKYAFYLMHALDRGEYIRTDRLKIHLTLALLRAGYLLDAKAYVDMWRKYTGNCYVKIETWYQDYWGWLDFPDSGPRTQENRSLPKRPSKALLEETVWRKPDICELEENK